MSRAANGSGLRRALRSLGDAFTSGEGCPLHMPWFRPEGSALARVRRLSLELAREEAGAPAWPAGRAALWPTAALIRALVNLRRHGAYVTRVHGRGPLSQVVDQLWLANRFNLVPRNYYQLHLFEAPIRARACEFVQEFELMRILRRLVRDQDAGAIDDKLRFHAHCERHALPVSRLVASFEPGRPAGVQPLPSVDLMLKPGRRYGGLGVERWERVSGRDAWRRNGETLDADGLSLRARTLAQDGPALLEERLWNHPGLVPLSTSGTLCTLRVVTLRFPSGEPEVLFVNFRMARGASEVDNVSAGGIVAPVDPTSGVSGAALALTVTDGVARVHPDTGAPIEGFPIPLFHEACALTLRAHATFPAFAFVGWDVALTPDGPVLLEGNTLWGLPELPPLGETKFAECVLAHLQR